MSQPRSARKARAQRKRTVRHETKRRAKRARYKPKTRTKAQREANRRPFAVPFKLF